MPRQLLATLALLAGALMPGLAPSGHWDLVCRVRDRMRDDLPSRTDYERMERGYYERLIEREPIRRLDHAPVPGTIGDPSARAFKVRAGLWSASFDHSPLIQHVDDLREIVFRPDGEAESAGVRWMTNAQGMRDRAYQAKKPPGTFRIALVGDSIGAGWGVDVEGRFESLLERSWDTRSRGRGGPAIEIINCAVPGHSPGQRWSHFTQVGLSMNPDLILYEATAADIDWDERRLRVLLARGVGWDSPLYRDTLERAGARPGRIYEEYKRILKPWHGEILSGVYRFMASESRAWGIPIVWVLVPRVGRRQSASEHQQLLGIARGAGFADIVDASDTFDGLNPSTLTINSGDYHPNLEGHARLAGRLDRDLSSLPVLRSVWDPPTEIGPIVVRPHSTWDPSLTRVSAEVPSNSPTQPASGVAK